MLKTLLIIGIGSFAGGTIRLNITGCLLIGVLMGFFDKGGISQEWRLFFATGLLGGFTTFSAFSIETITMLRDGQFFSAAAYAAASVLLGLFATYAGISITKFISPT